MFYKLFFWSILIYFVIEIDLAVWKHARFYESDGSSYFDFFRISNVVLVIFNAFFFYVFFREVLYNWLKGKDNGR